MRFELRNEAPGHDVAAWRCDHLVEAGFPVALAVRLGSDPRYDVHALIELTERGCPAEVAARILMPLEGASDV
jgi:hypothetical protein